jgi:GNAT superfamily N-acetyltransferase
MATPTAKEVVGMACVVGDGGTVHHISEMVVHPVYQRQKLGSRMMDALREWIDETASSERGAFRLANESDALVTVIGFESNRAHWLRDGDTAVVVGHAPRLR